jgi:thiol-disulfide isomerase/thioredoxin
MLRWLDAVKKSDSIVLLMTTKWCEYCEEQREILRAVEEEFSPFFVFVEEDADERPDLAVRYTPQVYPSISVIYRDNLLGGTYGLVSQESLSEVLLLSIDLINRGGIKVKVPFRIDRREIKFDPRYVFNHILRVCEGYFDWNEGGFEREPKHISPEVLRLFLKMKDTYHLGMVIYTLQKAIDNIWDNGFYAFSKSRDWSNPFKVKMIDLNSQMINVLLETYELTKDDFFLEYAIKTAYWLLSVRDRDGHFPIAVIDGKAIGNHYLNVNSMALEALYNVYTFTGDEKFLLENLPIILNHNLHDRQSPLFLSDIAFLLKFLYKLNRKETINDIIINLLNKKYHGNGAFYDTTKDYAMENKIGRFQFLYDNSVLAETLLRLNLREIVESIIKTLINSYYMYTYFNQAQFAYIIGEYYEFFT